MEKKAEALETDVITMVLNFAEFRNSEDKPTPSDVGKALWDTSKKWSELTELYNVFAWYTLEKCQELGIFMWLTIPQYKRK